MWQPRSKRDVLLSKENIQRNIPLIHQTWPLAPTSWELKGNHNSTVLLFCWWSEYLVFILSLTTSLCWWGVLSCLIFPSLSQFYFFSVLFLFVECIVYLLVWFIGTSFLHPLCLKVSGSLHNLFSLNKKRHMIVWIVNPCEDFGEVWILYWMD